MSSLIRHSPFSIRHCLFSLLFALSSPLPAAPPPPELTVLRTQYEKVLAERVTAPFDAALADLNGKYTGGLDRAIAEAKQAGDLKAVLAIEAEKKRLADKLPIPDEDDDATPAALKKLRPIYREQWKKLDAQRTANHGAILPAYTARLQSLEATLTKGDRVDEAKDVMLYREGLAVGVTSAVAEKKEAARSATAPAKESDETTDAGPKVSAEDASRQLVEWAVQNGHTAMVMGKKGAVTVKTAQDIPKEKFDLLKIESVGEPHEGPPWRLFQFTPEVNRLYIGLWDKIPVTPADVAMLRKLKKLRSLEFKGKVEDVRAVIAAMPPLPALTELVIVLPMGADELTMLAERCPAANGLAFVMRDGADEKDFTALTRFKHLSRLRMDSLKEPFTETAARIIGKLPGLADIGFMFPSAAPLAPSVAAHLPGIKSAQIHYRLPPGSIEGFGAVPSLVSLFFRNFDAFSEDDLKSLTSISKLTTLNLDGIAKLDDATLSRILTALPALEELRIVNCPAITDASLSALPTLKKLSKLTLGKNPGVTDAIFVQCKGLKKLKDLSLKDTALSDAALAAFKKQRPDVKVER